jgi:hypothetical protein
MTVIVTVPFPGGLFTVIWVSELTVTSSAILLPKLTVATVVNPEPLRTTEVPPAEGPSFGDTPETCGQRAVSVVSNAGAGAPGGTRGVILGSLREPAYLRTALACWSTSRVNKYCAYPKTTATAKVPAPG